MHTGNETVTRSSPARPSAKHLVCVIVLGTVIFGIEADRRRGGATWTAADLFPAEPQPAFPWVLHDGRHWQVASTTFEESDSTDATEGTRGACPSGMVEVRGRMRQDSPVIAIEAMQRLLCTRWLAETYPERCAEFDQQRWIAFVDGLSTVDMDFCIDRFEYPNVKGQFPWIFVRWTEAVDLCAGEGKRLCSEDEWTLACEGEDAWPYPYGFVRSAEACVIDRRWRA